MADVSNTVTKAIKIGIKERVVTGSLDPHEWDFRGINKHHLPIILFYERAREDKKLKHGLMLAQKHRRTIFGWDAGQFSKESVVSQIPGANPEDNYLCLIPIIGCWLSNKFPAPWMTLSKTEQEEAAKRYITNEQFSKKLGFRIISRKELTSIEAMEESFGRIFPSTPLARDSKTRIIIEVDWARLDNPVLKPLLGKLVELRPPGIWPRRRATGRAMTTPLHKLKQIAAWRLATKAGFSYAKAQKVISDRKELSPRVSEIDSDIFPKYESAGAWSEAVAAGGRFIDRGK